MRVGASSSVTARSGSAFATRTGAGARYRRCAAARGVPARTAVLAALVRRLDTMLVRIGNESTGVNGSFGLTALRHQHAAVHGGNVRLQFRARPGRYEARAHCQALLDAARPRAVYRQLTGQAMSS